MQCVILGTGGTMPMPGQFLSSAAVRVGGRAYLFDCGEGTQVPYKACHVGVGRLDLVAITHLHADHCLGLPGLLMLRAQIEEPGPLVLVGPEGLGRFVQHVVEDLDCFINYPVRIVEVPASLFAPGGTGASRGRQDEERGWRASRKSIVCETAGPSEAFRPGKSLLEVFRDEQVRLYCHPLDHSVFCLGYRLEEVERPGKFHPGRARQLGVEPGPAYARLQGGESVTTSDGVVVTPDEVMGPPRRGRHVAYCTDTAPCKGLYRLMASADLALLEGMYLPEHAREAEEKRHLEAVRAARMAVRAEVREARLIHFSPRYGEEEVARIDRLAREVSPVIQAGVPGEVIEVPLPD